MRFEKQGMKNELNKALRIISKEIGENVNLDEVFFLKNTKEIFVSLLKTKILLQENSWKGRAQQNQILQIKIK